MRNKTASSTTTVRLLGNPWLWEYHARSGTIVVNWYLYTFGLPALAFLAAAYLLRGDDAANKVFSGADANHDGVVTLEEAKAYGTKMGVGKKLAKEGDKNGDGCVDRAEVQAYYASKEGPVR